MEAIFNRRSIRKFQERPISGELVKQILRAGMAAPTAGNSQEWEFIVFSDPKKKERIMQDSEYAFPVKTAPVCILVCADLDREVHKDAGWWIQDCSAALENMLVEATQLGLGSIWLGVYPVKERVDGVREIFALPEHVMPLGLMALGYAAREKEPIDRYLEDRVHWEAYGKPYEGKTE